MGNAFALLLILGAVITAAFSAFLRPILFFFGATDATIVYAAAKRVELVLDDMLTNGYADVDGRPHGPNEAYIAEKSKIPGAEVTEAAPEVDSDYFADLVEDGYDAAQEMARQRAQETAQRNRR